MTNAHPIPLVRSLTLLVPLVLLGACAAQEAPLGACAGQSPVDEDAPVTRFEVRLEADGRPLDPTTELDGPGAVRLRPTKARLYLAEVELIDAQGGSVGAELVDEQGGRLPYELTLVDLKRAESLALHVKAPAGSYRGMRVSIGVPRACSSGERLNHADASSMGAPLDVDSDMYWTWNAGYVFVKYEGRVRTEDGWDGFFYHVGGGERLGRLELEGAFEVGDAAKEVPDVVVDFARLLRAPDGSPSPDVSQTSERRVHGGALADALARNIRASGFVRLEAPTRQGGARLPEGR